MILGELSTTTSSIDNNNDTNINNVYLEQHQPIVVLATASFIPIRITNYIGGEIFESLICSSYLDADDMISLLQISGNSIISTDASTLLCNQWNKIRFNI
jgi:hypothetical protein